MAFLLILLTSACPIGSLHSIWRWTGVIDPLEKSSLTVSYDSDSSRSPMLAEFVELWHYRDFLQLLVVNSIKTRYKRSALGVVWTLLNPLLNTVVLTIALSQLMRFEVENYPIYILVGYLVWNFFTF